MVYRRGMVDVRGKGQVLRQLAKRPDLTELERAAVLEAAALLDAVPAASSESSNSAQATGCSPAGRSRRSTTDAVQLCCMESGTQPASRLPEAAGKKSKRSAQHRVPASSPPAAVDQPISGSDAVEEQGLRVAEGVLFSDGASRGNPGPAGVGAVLETSAGQCLAEISEYIGSATNNVAEYRALLAGLERALALGIRRLEVRADSELMVKQLRGDYQVRSAGLLPLFLQARRLLGRFERVTLRHVRRELNTRADALANAGIDSAR